ncbi:hypothetical protein Tco_0355160 [Tanacetum coccineum]
MELVLEQTQQGTSHEVSVSTEGVEELKRKVKIKGEKKEALITLRQKSDNDSDGGEVLNELIEYENVGMLRQEKAINSFDEDDLAFQYIIGFRKSVAYFDLFLPMNIITRKAYNTIIVEGLETTGKNLVAVINKAEVEWVNPLGKSLNSNMIALRDYLAKGTLGRVGRRA